MSKISGFFKPLILNNGDYFLKTATQTDRLGFVQSGIMREFVFLEDKEVTKWISTKGYFVVDLSSFIFGHPARWNIQALADTEIFVINNELRTIMLIDLISSIALLITSIAYWINLKSK